MLNIPLVRDQLVKYSAITLQFKAQTVYKKWLELWLVCVYFQQVFTLND